MERPTVFVSSGTNDLRTCRSLVSDALLTKGYVPLVQEHLAPDAGTVRAALEKRIKKCDAVVHLVGACFGAEPGKPPRETGRRSFTQMEYDIAVALKKPLYIFICAENFPYDAHEPEDEERRRLQQLHRDAIRCGDHLYSAIYTPHQLELRIRELEIPARPRAGLLVRLGVGPRRFQLGCVLSMLAVCFVAGFFWDVAGLRTERVRYSSPPDASAPAPAAAPPVEPLATPTPALSAPPPVETPRPEPMPVPVEPPVAPPTPAPVPSPDLLSIKSGGGGGVPMTSAPARGGGSSASQPPAPKGGVRITDGKAKSQKLTFDGMEPEPREPGPESPARPPRSNLRIRTDGRPPVQVTEDATPAPLSSTPRPAVTASGGTLPARCIFAVTGSPPGAKAELRQGSYTRTPLTVRAEPDSFTVILGKSVDTPSVRKQAKVTVRLSAPGYVPMYFEVPRGDLEEYRAPEKLEWTPLTP